MSKITPEHFIRFIVLVLIIIFIPKTGYKPDKEYLTGIDREIFFANKTRISFKHEEFILGLMPLIQNANREIIEEREHLIEIIMLITSDEKVKQSEQRWLKKTAFKYFGEKNSLNINQDKEMVLIILTELLNRIDIVPVRLAIAQAAIESGWGDSRFCIEGNAYYGIHCYKPGCGIKAIANQESGFEVKSYKNAQESVNDYMLFLNSKKGTQSFRNERINYFYKDSIPDLVGLASSIKGYSEIGQSYHDMVESILNYYIPENIANY